MKPDRDTSRESGDWEIVAAPPHPTASTGAWLPVDALAALLPPLQLSATADDPPPLFRAFSYVPISDRVDYEANTYAAAPDVDMAPLNDALFAMPQLPPSSQPPPLFRALSYVPISDRVDDVPETEPPLGGMVGTPVPQVGSRVRIIRRGNPREGHEGLVVAVNPTKGGAMVDFTDGQSTEGFLFASLQLVGQQALASLAPPVVTSVAV